jgi:hypothetical protein
MGRSWGVLPIAVAINVAAGLRTSAEKSSEIRIVTFTDRASLGGCREMKKRSQWLQRCLESAQCTGVVSAGIAAQVFRITQDARLAGFHTQATANTA